MMIKSQRQGRDEREARQEVRYNRSCTLVLYCTVLHCTVQVELEEHLECGCGCEPGAAEACVTRAMFNPATCECECTELIWGPERDNCAEREGEFMIRCRG